MVLSNLDTLCSVALGEKVTEDFLLARDTVITICSITDHVRVSLNKQDFVEDEKCNTQLSFGQSLNRTVTILG